MLANSNNWKDVKKYFEGTYIVCPEYDEKKILMVEHVEPNGMKVYDVDKTSGFIDWSEDSYNIRSPLASRRSWFQHGNQAYLMQRIPARMWRKGICDQNTTCRGINTIGDMTNGLLSFALAQSFLTFKEPDKLPEDLDAYHTYALSDKFSVQLKSGRLYLYHSPIGSLSFGRKRLSILREFGHISLPRAIQYWDTTYV